MIITQHFKLNLGAWTDGLGEVRIYLNLSNITNLQYCTQDVTEIDLTYEWDGTRELSALINDDWELYDDNNITDLLVSPSDFIEFDAEISIDQTNYQNLLTAIQCGLITMGGGGKTLMLLYRLNDEKESVSKNLTFVNILTGNFKAPLGIKNIEIDVVDYNIDNSYNYVFIPILNRFYYITNIQFINKDYTRLIMQEDVLMSWKDLIKQQEAQITRYGGASDRKLYDDRFPLKDIPEITYNTPVFVSGSDCILLSYTMGTVSGETTKKPNVFLSTVGEVIDLIPDDTNDIDAPRGTALPDIQSRRGGFNHNYLMNISDLQKVINACIREDGPASYIRSALLLPFDLTDVFPDATRNYHIYAGTKQLINGTGGYVWGNPSSENTEPITWQTKKGSSPYIKIADFYFNSDGGIDITDSFIDFAPNTLWEIYIPFVGWIQLDSRAIYNDRIMVYYTFDFDTGISTACIYNVTKGEMVWSGSCQIGMRLPIATTNADELARQKQATGLNLIMGLLSSGISAVGSAYGGNSVGVAGGVVSGVKSITGAINSFNSMIERAQITYGSSDNALYSINEVVIKKTTHKPILTTTDQINKYAKINGYPYRDYKLISDLTAGNYIEVGDIHFNAKGENIYNDEIVEIVQLLKNGVII